MSSITLRGATIVDGTGREPFTGDVLVEDETIVDIVPARTVERGDVIECSGHLLTPGFIDIHSHSDLTLLLDPRAASAIHQGVTLEVIGNCGHGCAPLRDVDVARAAIYGRIPTRDFFDWPSRAGYFDRLEAAAPAINVVALVPNGQLRLSTIGLTPRAADAPELAS